MRGGNPVNDREIAAKVHSSMYRQYQKRGCATVDAVLMDLGILKKEQSEVWRYGRAPYLERVCTINLCKLSTILREMRVYAGKANLKPSFCFFQAADSQE